MILSWFHVWFLFYWQLLLFLFYNGWQFRSSSFFTLSYLYSSKTGLHELFGTDKSYATKRIIGSSGESSFGRTSESWNQNGAGCPNWKNHSARSIGQFV